MKRQSVHTKRFRMWGAVAIGSITLLSLVSLQSPVQAKPKVQTPTVTLTRTQTPTNNHEQSSAPGARKPLGMESPVVPPLTLTPTPLPGSTPLPTVAIDPNDPLKGNAHYLKAKAALDSLHFTLLPVQRDSNLRAFRFFWNAGWVEPNLSTVPHMVYLPGGIPYFLKFHFYIRKSNDPLGTTIDRYPLAGKNEIILYDSELASGEWEWTVRGEYRALQFMGVTRWSEWQPVTIRK